MHRLSRLAPARRPYSSMSTTSTPLEDAMRTKIQTALSPTTLQIHNDSHLHSHHKAMATSTSQETHFRAIITSDAFVNKSSLARHRMVNALLKEELAREGGIHALQLKTLTVEEARKAAEEAEKN